MPADELATRLTGGVTLRRAAGRHRHARSGARCGRPTSSSRRCPNQLFMRDTSAWIYGGVVDQLDVLARAPARDAQRRGGLPLPPALPRRRLPDLVRRRRPRLGQRLDRGRRHHARRRRRRARRPGRAHERARRQHPRQEPVRRRRGPAGDRRADAARRARRCTSTPCSRSATATSRRSTSRSCRRSCRSCYTPDGDGGVRAEVSERSFLDEVKDALGLTDLTLVADRRRRVRGRAQPVGRRQQRRRAVARARSSPTSATRPPTPSSRRPASRSSRSPARSSAADAAAATA